MTARQTVAPKATEIEEIADRAYRALPAVFRAPIDEVVIRIEEFPSDQVIADMELESPFDLLGLYHGVPLDERGVGDVRQDVDMIFLYRRPLLDYWVESGETLESVVRHVLIHEIGHHFGFCDAEMERIEAEG